MLAILRFAEVQIRNANKCLSSLLIGFRSNQLFTQAEGSSGSEEAVASNPFSVPSLSCHLRFALLPWFIVHPASAPSAPRLIWENDLWALRSQAIQGHWQVISADWPTSKRTSEWSQWAAAPPSPPGVKALPLPSHPPQFISSLCHMTRARRQRGED